MIFEKLKGIADIAKNVAKEAVTQIQEYDPVEAAMAKADKKREDILKKASSIVAKDFNSTSYKYYINNDYSTPYNQDQWRDLYKKLSAEEDPQAMAPIYNAIVIDENRFYIRKGLQYLRNCYKEFKPGINDEIENLYIFEPYTYIKDEAAARRYLSTHKETTSYTAPKPATVSTPQPQPSKPQPLTTLERAELNNAKNRYERAINETKMHPASRATYESLEKKAYADYMRVLAKYAGRM